MRTAKIVCSIGARGSTMLARGPQGWRSSSDTPQRYRCAVVTDLIDESYLSLDVPKLGASDRHGFIEMQLQNRFPDTALRASLPYRSKQHPGRVMLTGVGNAQAEQTITALAESPAELLGVWSLPTLLMGSLSKHIRKLPMAFIAMLPTPDGLRVLVVLDGVPVLTRLLPLSNTGRQNQDVVATRRYLEDGRLIERGAPLALLALDCPADQVNALAESGFKPISAPWRPPRQGTEYDRLLDLAFDSLPGQLAPNRLRERFRLRMVHKVLVASTAAGVSVAAFAALQNGQKALDTWSQISSVKAEADKHKAEAERANLELKQLGVDAELLLAARKVQAEALGPAPDPFPALQQVSRLAASLPEWRLTRLEWQRTPLREACRQGPAPGDTSAGSGPGSTLPSPSAVQGAGPATASPMAAASPAAMPGAGTPDGASPPERVTDILEMKLSFEAPESDSPLAGTRRRDQLVKQIKAWKQAELRRGGEKSDATTTLSGAARKSTEQQKKLETQQFCLALRDPGTKTP